MTDSLNSKGGSLDEIPKSRERECIESISRRKTGHQGRGVTQERDSFGGHPPDGNCSCLGDLEKGSVRESNSPQGHWRETSARAWMRRIQSSKSVRHLPPKGAEVGFPLKYPCLKRVMEPTARAGHRM